MNPNLTQVGGTHYRSPFQHWDLVVRLKLGYFEGQITKYVTRHRFKNGKQDLDKALHFLLKLMTLVQENGWQATHLFPTTALLDEYSVANRLVRQESDVIHFVCVWTSLEQLKLAEHALGLLTRQYYELAPGLAWPVVRTDEERLAILEGTYPPCKGKNCGATDGRSHSAECIAEHEEACNPGRGYVDQGRDF